MWRRHILAWEEETVAECSSLMRNVILQDHIHDRWWWLLDPIDGYSVKGTYHYLTATDVPLERDLFDTVWQKQVPLKVSVFAWRLLRNRLPTKDNLLRRRVIHHDDIFCIDGCGSLETAIHLLFRCDIFGSVWHHLYLWVDISFIALDFVSDHLHQFGRLAGLPRSTHSFLTVI